jgi:hypothetical protein
MALIIPLIIFVALAAIIVWVADWTTGGRRYAALADLASGEIDQPEYDEKRKSADKIRRTRNRGCLRKIFQYVFELNSGQMHKRPSPWSIEDIGACFVVKDGGGQKLAYVYYEEEPGRRSDAHQG